MFIKLDSVLLNFILIALNFIHNLSNFDLIWIEFNHPSYH